MNDDLNIYVQEMIKKYGSALGAKQEMIKEYVLELNVIIQNGAIYGDEKIESLKLEWQNHFDILEEFLHEQRREDAIDNMELLDEDENNNEHSLDEITQDTLDTNGAGSFSRF